MNLRTYANFVKLEHALFALPLIYAGVFLASSRFPTFSTSLSLMVAIALAGFGARTFAFVANRIIDREIDAKNLRTSNRELPVGRMNLWEAYLVGGFGAFVYFVSTFSINEFCFKLSPVPLIVFIIYPYLKRFTPWCHFGVGLADALAPLAGYVAVSESFPTDFAVWFLFLFTFFWVSGFDMIYSLLDEEFDRENNVYSVPAVYGSQIARRISGVLHLMAWFCLFGTLMVADLFHLWTYLVFALVGFLLLWEHFSKDVEFAFFKLNAVVGFAILVLTLL